jgi:transposase
VTEPGTSSVLIAPWVGYKVHQTEACDVAAPHVIVNVETTAASVPDDNMLANVHAAFARRHLLPAEHLVDKAHFSVDWDRRVVTCPAGRHSRSWLPKTTIPGVVAEARFAADDCTPCPHRTHCTKAKKEPHIIGLQPRDQYEALRAARQAQTSEAFRQAYAARAGIESAHAQAVRRCGLRQCRYIGLAKTRLQHVVTAVAVNLIRVWEWLAGTPIASTRRSRFAALQGAA